MLQARIKEFEEFFAADEEHRIAGFSNIEVLEEFEDGDRRKVFQRKAVDLESSKTAVLDTGYAVADVTTLYNMILGN